MVKRSKVKVTRPLYSLRERGNVLGVGNYCYVVVSSAALGASAPTEGGEGRGHTVAAARLQLVFNRICVNAAVPGLVLV